MTSHFLYVCVRVCFVPQILISLRDVWFVWRCMPLSICYEKLMRRRINEAKQTKPIQIKQKKICVSKSRRQYKHITQRYVSVAAIAAAAAALIFTVCHFIRMESNLVSLLVQRRCLALLFG